ncbi:MAG: hypothetical protein HJJLKODD_00869 [Phycisphaerae bacterium]|nr:hypothetical protein [Phycisphaerae bacterium]
MVEPVMLRYALSGILLLLGSGERSETAYSERVAEVRRQLGDSFTVEIEKPFVVASDQSAAEFRRSREGTIRWAVRMLQQDYFDKPPSDILTIYLFNGADSYQQHVQKLFNTTPDTPYGYYSARHQALVMNIATGGGTLVHEIVHPYMEANFPDCPAWFNEGMGSLFEQCHERDDHIVGLLNWRLAVLKSGIAAGDWVPLEKLLATSTTEFYDDPQGMHYAQARYLCYYLQEQGVLREFYRKFVAEAQRDPTGVATLCSVLNVENLQQAEEQWRKFIETLPEKAP